MIYDFIFVIVSTYFCVWNRQTVATIIIMITEKKIKKEKNRFENSYDWASGWLRRTSHLDYPLAAVVGAAVVVVVVVVVVLVVSRLQMSGR